MKTLAISMVVLGSVLSGCVAVPVDDGRGYRQQYSYDRDGQRYYERDGRRYYGDRDRDGVPNNQDRRPDDPRRY